MYRTGIYESFSTVTRTTDLHDLLNIHDLHCENEAISLASDMSINKPVEEMK